MDSKFILPLLSCCSLSSFTGCLQKGAATHAWLQLSSHQFRAKVALAKLNSLNHIELNWIEHLIVTVNFGTKTFTARRLAMICRSFQTAVSRQPNNFQRGFERIKKMTIMKKGAATKRSALLSGCRAERTPAKLNWFTVDDSELSVPVGLLRSQWRYCCCHSFIVIVKSLFITTFLLPYCAFSTWRDVFLFSSWRLHVKTN